MDSQILEHYQDKLVFKNRNNDSDDESIPSDSELLESLENEMENNEDFLSNYREKRLHELSNKLKETRSNLSANQQDFGKLLEFNNDEKSLISLISSSSSVVVHFYNPNFKTCILMNNKLSILCQKHPNTKFAFINPNYCPFLVEKFKVTVLPSLLSFKKGKLIDKLTGLQLLQYDEKKNDFNIRILENYLYNLRIIEKISINVNIHKTEELKNGKIRKTVDDDSDDDFFD